MGLHETILTIFGVIAIGYGAACFRLLKEAVGDGLSDFVFVIAAPILLFKTIVSADFHGTVPWALWIAYFSGVVVTWAVSHIAIRLIFGRDRRAGVVAGVSGSFSNLVFLGLPIMMGAFGNNGFAVLTLIIAIHLPIMMGASITLYEWALRRDGMADNAHGAASVVFSFFNSLLRNPLIIGIVLGWMWRFGGLPIPRFADHLINMLAAIAGPVALFAMGMGLRKFGVSGNVKASLVLSAIKLLVMPAVVMASVWFLNVAPLAAQVAVTAAALPAGVNSYLIATRFGTGQALASNSMVLGTAFSAITMTFWISLALKVFG
ncbi:MAG: AEC family transporter [Phyllobacterium sp.]